MKRRQFLKKYSLVMCVAVLCVTELCVGQIPSQSSKPETSDTAKSRAETNTSSTVQQSSPTNSQISDPISVTEDWSTPSLQGSELTPAEPLIGEKDEDDPEFTRELIQVQWRPADPIDLYVIKPVGVRNPPVILYLYSYPFETDRFGNDGFCKFLTKNGFAAVGFASALTGGRYHSRPMKQWFVSELQESLSTSAHDVQMILNYLAKRGDLDMNRVGMFGDGSGAAIAILAAAVDPRIKTLDLLDPWGDWPTWMAKSTRIPEKEQLNFLMPEFLAKVAPLDPVKWLPELKTPKIRIQNVMTVTVTPNESKQRIEAAAPTQAQVIRYENGRALLNATADGKGFDWIKEQTEHSAAPFFSVVHQQPFDSSSTDTREHSR
ncbi:MAG TPA: alpha/beta hydrolase [Terriglobales bacterium]|nr:alpha/beta hydrolase [Terriglobales bacterium]